MTHSSELNWSFSSLGCPELGLEEIVKLAQQYDLSRLELRTVEDRVDLPELFKGRYGNAETLSRYLSDEGMSVVALDASLKLVGNTPSDRDEFLKFMEWADALGAPNVRIFDGGSFTPELGEADMEAALETISWWRGEQAGNGWKADIMVETHDCLTATRAVQQLQAALSDPVRILWDTHHTWKKADEKIEDTWAALKEWIPHVHVKDSISEPSARHPFTYVMLGDGEFDLASTVDLLRGEAFQGTVSIEWERKWHPYLPPLGDALKRARELGWW
ncbi:TIM barrel protein [Puniceicoccales bacterium CK1056]|uniref:TIM barrel protein n=1 Tax=Oceanipulchritudo coccoides TaxID=2706888 RepID=A0A6B2M2G1_9BACT|nr:TIM barrel protein [Oceanipulchritudo coccoides]NDV62267.1 TIM barrel protein [Oceanipulchritudo coccoides]